MRKNQRKIALIGLLGLFAVITTVSGCSGRNGAPRRWHDEPAFSPDGSNVVQKPIYPAPTNSTKPFFLGGYAGATY